MKKLILILATLPMCLLAGPDSDSFAEGDYLFVKARITGCGSQERFVEAGQVTDSGQVILFNEIRLQVTDRTTAEITTQLVDALEQRTGHKSKTIKITRVPAEDAKKAASLMMIIHSERSRDCELNAHPEDFPDWIGEFQLARLSSHKKSLNKDAGAA